MGILANLLAAFSIMTVQPQVASNELVVPEQYQHTDTAANVFFLTPAEVNYACGNRDPQWIVYACANPKNHVIVLPDACLYPEAKDFTSYAYLVCHEKAHLLGWEHP
jgi:hypothetical protein